MRLGGVLIHPGSVAGIDDFKEVADRYGLSAIVAPAGLDRMGAQEAANWGERCHDAGLVIGEAGFWDNLLTPDTELAADRMARLHRTLRNAGIMGCRSVAILPGSRHHSDKGFAADAFMRSREGRGAVRDMVCRALEGMPDGPMRLGMEPYAASFFYRPEDVLAFIEDINDPRFGLHLDLANMLTVDSFFASAKVIDEWLPRLAPHAVSCHLKDLDWPVSPYGLAFAEVDLGEGAIDLGRYLSAIDTLMAPDMTVFCEHYSEQADYFRNFERAHAIAASNGLRFLPRTSPIGE
ncbi:sugar phosphate isomerase/epimerase [Paracoccus sp. SCSIO 75233]|uniref:sugar phosphate isomerase/epimerase family protein n=1 Tax=Paracoccus sp. SCSIO 75233 TaxID=3017782 RepID=UPI0022F03155|nr:TIM barrel protein [Paracoccus sp. SCSIO 75233]WBU52028.1 TIM barrel protein [Paracoccus sp. SCSIO 75233]